LPLAELCNKEAKMVARNKILWLVALSSALIFCVATKAGEQATIPAGSKVYIAAMDGFETHLKTAMESKKVPLVVVENKQDAAYEITGVAASQKASTAKKVIMGSWHSREEASIQVTDLKTGVVVFAYSVLKTDSAHGQRSSAEACTKHLKSAIKPQ
jgi:hypothetical protein